MLGPRIECPNCGHDWHPSGAAGSCAVLWMGERCACRRMSPPDPDRYRAELGGSAWAIGPVASFATIRAARHWAEEYGSTADRCIVTDRRRGRIVAEHRRDPLVQGDPLATRLDIGDPLRLAPSLTA